MNGASLLPEERGGGAAAGQRVPDPLGYLPEQPPLFEELTGREQLRYVAALHDIPPAEAEPRVQGYLERFGLAVERLRA